MIAGYPSQDILDEAFNRGEYRDNIKRAIEDRINAYYDKVLKEELERLKKLHHPCRVSTYFRIRLTSGKGMTCHYVENFTDLECDKAEEVLHHLFQNCLEVVLDKHPGQGILLMENISKELYDLLNEQEKELNAMKEGSKNEGRI